MDKHGTRGYQREAVRKIIETFQSDPRAQLHAACGTGKSRMAYLTANELGARRAGWFVPSLHLEKQFLEEMRQQDQLRKLEARYLVIGSDQSVTNDDILVRPEEFQGAEFLGCDKDFITRTLKRLTREQRRINVYCTYQSGAILAAAAREAKFPFSFAVNDEAHRTVGARDGLFAYLLHEENIKIARRLFMTATPRIFRGVNGEDAIDMDDAHYGPVAETISFLRAIQLECLTNYRIATHITKSERLADFLSPDVKQRPDAATAVALLAAVRDHRIKHLITYHRTVKRASEFRDTLEEVNRQLSTKEQIFDLHVNHIHGALPVADRMRRIDEAMQHQYSVTTNARCLQEGIDEKRFDGVCFVDTKASTTDIVQSVGRALRLPPMNYTKDYGWIVVPTVLDPGVDFHDLTKGPWKNLAAILRHMGGFDESLVDHIRKVALGLGGIGGGSGPILGFEGDLDVKEAAELLKITYTRAHRSRVASKGRLTTTDYRDAAHRRGWVWLGTKVGGVYETTTVPRAQAFTWWRCASGHTVAMAYMYVVTDHACTHCTGRGFRATRAVEIVRLYAKEHWTLQQIATHFKVAMATISRALEQKGIERRPNISVPTAATVLARYEKGEGIRAIAKDYPFSTETVRKILREGGARIRNEHVNHHLTEDNIVRIVQQYARGDALTAIYAEHKLSSARLYRILRNKGVVLRQPGKAVPRD